MFWPKRSQAARCIVADYQHSWLLDEDDAPQDGWDYNDYEQWDGWDGWDDDSDEQDDNIWALSEPDAEQPANGTPMLQPMGHPNQPSFAQSTFQTGGPSSSTEWQQTGATTSEWQPTFGAEVPPDLQLMWRILDLLDRDVSRCLEHLEVNAQDVRFLHTLLLSMRRDVRWCMGLNLNLSVSNFRSN